MTKFIQNAWLYIDMNIGLRMKAKNDFEKDSLKLMKNIWENIEILNLSQQREEGTI